MKIDNSLSYKSQSPRRFFLLRLKDETGISRTGRVLEGIVTQSGKVIAEWRPPHSTVGIYKDFNEFKLIHVDCHPSCNKVVWLDCIGGDSHSWCDSVGDEKCLKCDAELADLEQQDGD